jgi:hypothetical protein
MSSSSATQRGIVTSLAPVSTMKGARTRPLRTATTRIDVPARCTLMRVTCRRPAGRDPLASRRAGGELLSLRTRLPPWSSLLDARARERCFRGTWERSWVKCVRPCSSVQR